MEAEDKISSLLSETEHQCHGPLYLSSVADLEIMVEARLHLAAIALQRFRPAYR